MFKYSRNTLVMMWLLPNFGFQYFTWHTLVIFCLDCLDLFLSLCTRMHNPGLVYFRTFCKHLIWWIRVLSLFCLHLVFSTASWPYEGNLFGIIIFVCRKCEIKVEFYYHSALTVQANWIVTIMYQTIHYADLNKSHLKTSLLSCIILHDMIHTFPIC
jgi:hypothetical protein